MTCSTTKLGSKFYVSSEDITNCDPMTQTEFEALTWVEVGKITSLPEFGFETNFVERNFVSGGFTKRGKGYSSGMDTEIMVGPDMSDLGQVELIEAGAPTYKFNRGFKLEGANAITPTGTNAIQYSFGLVSGPKSSGGEGEEFDEFTFGLALNQAPVLVAAT